MFGSQCNQFFFVDEVLSGQIKIGSTSEIHSTWIKFLNEMNKQMKEWMNEYVND